MAKLFISTCMTLACCFYVSTHSLAQGCCSGGTPLSGNLDLSSTDPRNFSVRLTYDHNNLGDIVFESKELEDKSRTRITNATLLRFNYTFNKHFATSLLFSHVKQEEVIKFNNTNNSTVGRGLGDIVFLLQYNAYQKNNTSISLAGGFKAPTGPIGRKNETTGLLLNPDLQPGTGSWDFLAITQFAQKNIFINFLNFQTLITYRITDDAERFNQQQVYKFGNELQAYFGFNYNLYIKKYQFSPLLMFRYRQTAPDKTDGFETINTGGKWGHLVTGFDTFFVSNIGVGLLAEIPVYRSLDGIQLTTSYKLTASVSYNFSLKKKEE